MPSRCGAQFCMICGVKWRGCDCPWFPESGYVHDSAAQANVPVPQIRGDVHDMLDSEGPPLPAELRDGGSHPVTMAVRMRPRPGGYQEEMLVRQLQERRDAEAARQLQQPDKDYQTHDMTGGVGDVQGVGNAAGHLIKDSYRRGARYARGTPAQDRGGDYVADVGRATRGGHGVDSMERRLADRLSETRTGAGLRGPPGPRMAPLSPPLSPPMSPAMRAPAMMAPPATTGAGAGGPADAVPRSSLPGRGGLRRHSLEAELYSRLPQTARSERAASGRASRKYQDEAEAHASRGTRQRLRGATVPALEPRPSDMAGLTSYGGQGMGRVSQWRTFVEPGVPDGESVKGHA